jgi:lipopolysaccharide heptosyltransferase II
LDREALVLRNRLMAEAFHSTPIKHQVRRLMLATASYVPIAMHKSSSTERILLIRPDHLGDVLLTTPAIAALRTAKPTAEIHALVGPWSADVIANYPEIDLVLTMAFPGFSRTPKTNWRSPYEIAVTTSRQLRRIGYSSAVILRPDHWWGALVAKLAGIPERIGYQVAEVAPFLTDTIPHQHEHAVVQNLRLVEKWTGTIPPEKADFHFPIHSFDQVYVDGYLEEWGIRREEPIFCIHPGTGTWVKHWDEAKWARVADTLAGQLDAKIVFTGGDHELPLVQRIVGQMEQPACIIAGDTRVGQLAALFKRAQVVLGPDSGPLHLAAAVGTPTVALYGPADPVEFSPWGDPQKHFVVTTDIGCRPCRVLDWGSDDPNFHPCVREIPIARVLEAARRAVNYNHQ